MVKFDLLSRRQFSRSAYSNQRPWNGVTKHRATLVCHVVEEQKQQAQSSSASTSVQQPTAPVSLPMLAQELQQGIFWDQCKRQLPAIPWVPTQLVQVMAGGVGAAGLLALVAAAAQQQAAGSDPATAMSLAQWLGPARFEAARHAAQEGLLLLAVTAILATALRESKPRSKGLFIYKLPGEWAAATLALCAVLFPLVDPVLYSGWRAAVDAVSNGQLTPATNLVDSLRSCVEQGDSTSLGLHLLASGVMGPLWEETFWRGFFLASLTKVLPLPLCVAASSFNFALLHLSPHSALPILVLSAACDLLYLRSASLGPPLALHAAWNIYQLVGIAFLGKDVFV